MEQLGLDKSAVPPDPIVINYKQARKYFNSLNRKKMIDFFSSKGVSDFKNSKKFWLFYKSSVKLRSDISVDECPDLIIYDGVSETDPKKMSTLFNEFFTSLKSESPATELECNEYIENLFKDLKRSGAFEKEKENEKDKENQENQKKLFEFKQIDVSYVNTLLGNLSSCSSPGVSGIHAKVIKSATVTLAPILTNLINDCIDQDVMPDEWKMAMVTPLHKKNSRSDVNNYRGISILSPISKLFEKVICSQITSFFEDNNLLYEGQHGFRKGYSCETALHELLEKINSARNKRLITLLLFIDFRKAFDLVEPRFLLLKLFHYGFGNKSLRLLSNYFSDRNQVVRLRNFESEKKPVRLGVPQGSTLGPLFFLIFINDLPFLLKRLESKLFADDTTLLKSGEDADTLIHDFKIALKPFIEWCKYNRLDINWSKTEFMFICDKRKVQLPEVIYIDGTPVKVVSSFKLLGVTIDNKLSFRAHVSAVCSIINRKLFSIKRLFYLATSVKMQFFKSFILPYFDYCLSLSVYFPKATLQKLATCYYATLFRLFKFDFSELDSNAINDFLKNYGLFAFQHRIMLRLSLFTYKIISERAPPILRNLITSAESNDGTGEATLGNIREKKVIALRSGQKTVLYNPESKYEKISFASVFSNVKNYCIFPYFNSNFKKFKSSICTNLNTITTAFSNIFPSLFYLIYRKYNYKKIIKKVPKKGLK